MGGRQGTQQAGCMQVHIVCADSMAAAGGAPSDCRHPQ